MIPPMIGTSDRLPLSAFLKHVGQRCDPLGPYPQPSRENGSAKPSVPASRRLASCATEQRAFLQPSQRTSLTHRTIMLASEGDTIHRSENMHSSNMNRLFEVEIGNEDCDGNSRDGSSSPGGASPATLDSALDSVM